MVEGEWSKTVKNKDNNNRNIDRENYKDSNQEIFRSGLGPRILAETFLDIA